MSGARCDECSGWHCHSPTCSRRNTDSAVPMPWRKIDGGRYGDPETHHTGLLRSLCWGSLSWGPMEALIEKVRELEARVEELEGEDDVRRERPATRVYR